MAATGPLSYRPCDRRPAVFVGGTPSAAARQLGNRGTGGSRGVYGSGSASVSVTSMMPGSGGILERSGSPLVVPSISLKNSVIASSIGVPVCSTADSRGWRKGAASFLLSFAAFNARSPPPERTCVVAKTKRSTFAAIKEQRCRPRFASAAGAALDLTTSQHIGDDLAYY
jgi:hypothetical protein